MAKEAPKNSHIFADSELMPLLASRQTKAGAANSREVLNLDPKNLDALNSLAWIEGTHPDARLRNEKRPLATRR